MNASIAGQLIPSVSRHATFSIDKDCLTHTSKTASAGGVTPSWTTFVIQFTRQPHTPRHCTSLLTTCPDSPMCTPRQPSHQAKLSSPTPHQAAASPATGDTKILNQFCVITQLNNLFFFRFQKKTTNFSNKVSCSFFVARDFEMNASFLSSHQRQLHSPRPIITFSHDWRLRQFQEESKFQPESQSGLDTKHTYSQFCNQLET